MSYDYRNRIRSIIYNETSSLKAENSGKRITFIYDVLGRRVSKNVVDLSDSSSETTEYVYSGDEVIEEYENVLSSTDYVLSKSYILGESIDKPIALIVEPNAYHVARTTYYYHANAQQSIMAMTNESGAVAERYSYDAYGKQTVYDAFGQIISIPQSEIRNQYGYTGRRIDSETGLMYFRARYYSPELGRFISRDPLAFVDGMNLYAGYFAMFGMIDPRGLNSCENSISNVVDEFAEDYMEKNHFRDDRGEFAKIHLTSSMPFLALPLPLGHVIGVIEWEDGTAQTVDFSQGKDISTTTDNYRSEHYDNIKEALSGKFVNTGSDPITLPARHVQWALEKTHREKVNGRLPNYNVFGNHCGWSVARFVDTASVAPAHLSVQDPITGETEELLDDEVIYAQAENEKASLKKECE